MLVATVDQMRALEKKADSLGHTYKNMRNCRKWNS